MNYLKILLVTFLVILSACSKNESNNLNNFVRDSKSFQPIKSDEKATTKKFSDDVQASYLQLAAMLRVTMIDCPTRIWPDYNWKKMSVILLEKGKPSLVWKGSTGQIENLDEDKVPTSAPKPQNPMISKLNEEDAVSIYSNGIDNHKFFSSAQNLFGLIVHEGFHLLAQRTWKGRTGKRGTSYPIEATPRKYRRMIFDNLKAYFVSKGADATSLRKASFWFRKWQSEFHHETLATTDGYEGTARYMEYMAPSLVESGCAASDEDLFTKLFTRVTGSDGVIGSLGNTVSGDRLELDSEGYDIGGISAFILRFIVKNTTWYDEVKSGTTPLEILLKNVEAVEDIIPAEIEAKFLQTQNISNASVSQWLEEEIKHLNDVDFERIVFSDQASQGSYSPEGFYLPRDFPGITFMPLAMLYEFKIDSWSMTAEVKKVMIDAPIDSPCGGGKFLTLVAKSDVSILDGKIKIARKDIHGEMIGSEKKDANGFSWFCGE